MTLLYIEAEIKRAVKKIVACDTDTYKNNSEISQLTKEILEKTLNLDTNVDFRKFERFVLSQGNKKRIVVKYPDLDSAENVLCQCIKQILDKAFHVKYPNRNKIARELFDVMAAIVKMSDFTIVRFDFKNFFNSISTNYVYEKIIKNKISDRLEQELIEKFSLETEYAYAGLSTSNVIAEIIALQFDEFLQKQLWNKGLIFYERYIDDGIIILNQHYEEKGIVSVLDTAVKEIFRNQSIGLDKKCKTCKTSLNRKKFSYIARREIGEHEKMFDFLGYNFTFHSESNGKMNGSLDISVQYGMTLEKREKYKKRVKKLIREYKNSDDEEKKKLELLRHQIAAFTRRTVYLTKKSNTYIWKVKGFISNYGELRDYLETDHVDKATTTFLKTMVEEAFKEEKMALPYFMNHEKNKKAKKEEFCGYNLYDNMKRNRTLLLVQHIGYNAKSLRALCKQIDILPTDCHKKWRDYDKLVREYLIKVKVGY